MFKFAAALAIIGSAAAFAPAQTGRTSTSVSAFTIDNMPGALAPMGFFDPLNFAEKADENTLKRYREAEVTHGRVAMLAVLGFLVGESVEGSSFLFDASTSFYTTTEKQETYDSLDDVLDKKCADETTRTVIKDMLDACADITEALRTALVTVEDSSNTFGDAQLSVDMIADNLMWEACKNSAVIREGASEEDPEVRDTGDGEFTVCWDPLDGSSIVDNNWAVGTIIGIWPKSTGLIGATGRDQTTSMVAIYGPRTTVIVALDDGTYEFSYGCTPEGCQLPDGSFEPWICSRHDIKIEKDTKIFSPANLRATQEVAGYKKLIDHYLTDRKTLRYSGGLVPDIYQQFTKTMGVFSNPTSKESPAKIRLAFEAAPFALLVEKAGGKSSDGVTGGSILDVQINGVDQRCALCIGSANEVDRFNSWVVKGE